MLGLQSQEGNRSLALYSSKYGIRVPYRLRLWADQELIRVQDYQLLVLQEGGGESDVPYFRVITCISLISAYCFVGLNAHRQVHFMYKRINEL